MDKQLDPNVLIGTVAGLVTAMIAANTIHGSYDVKGAINDITDALVKAAERVAQLNEPEKPGAGF